MLEVGSGTGQHAAHFARALPQLVWQASDVPANLPGIRLWLADAGLPNTPAPIAFDINDDTAPPGSGSNAAESPVFQFIRALEGIDKPVVAAVTGAAIGIGTTMLLHCDLVYVSDEARLAMPFVSLGLVPEFASSLIVPKLLGNVKAAEKLLLGDPFSPEDAVDARIANAVLPAGEVVNHARRIAERFNGLPPGAVRETKKLLRRTSTDEILKTIAVEGELFGARLRSPEAMEAFQAFFQKRKPDFSKFS